MSGDPEVKDLGVLVADKNMWFTVRGLLSRPEALGIAAPSFEIYDHPENDPGCFHEAPEFFRTLRSRFRHAVVLLDHEGSGRDHEDTALQLEEDLEARLAPDWGDRAAAVVIEPELEAWVWSDSPHVETQLGWKDRTPDLRTWLVEHDYLAEGAAKPERPKEAVKKALRMARRPRSSAIYESLARSVSFRRCQDRSFQRFCKILRGWFPPRF